MKPVLGDAFICDSAVEVDRFVLCSLAQSRPYTPRLHHCAVHVVCVCCDVVRTAYVAGWKECRAVVE